ncbi:peroxin [Tilletia horrida]|uniref:Peroxin n=1 Tax=Tilletia horrida TaxID=155126 RepID=A0AAN6JQK6_9BASI|nr:peroxin [Tilletia horrida]KAK0547874.1 peroxin [Tilletia horrida]KAK0567989.1 peroxin [Tilletia horrida]
MPAKRLNLVVDAPVPGPGSAPARRWFSSNSSSSISRSYLSFFSRTLTVVVIGVAATYAATKYALSRISEIQRGISQQRRDSDNLKRRFAQNQEDCTFTVLALLPTLDSAITAKYDVDSITKELSAKAAVPAPALPAPVSAQQVEEEKVPAPASVADPVSEDSAPDPAAEESPVEADGAVKAEEQAEDPKPAPELTIADADPITQPAALAAPRSEEEASKSESDPAPIPPEIQSNKLPLSPSLLDSGEPNKFPTETASTTEATTEPPAQEEETAPDGRTSLPPEENAAVEVPAEPQTAPDVAPVQDADPTPAPGTQPSETESEPQPESEPEPTPAPSPPPPPPPAPTLSPEEIQAQKQRKVQLWNELKVTAFTRTLTTLYSLVLLSLQTHIQLNLVGRFNYLSSVAAIARGTGGSKVTGGVQDDDADEDDGPFGPGGPFEKEAGLDGAVGGTDGSGEEASSSSDPNELLRSVEQRYLTYSWWLLHRGSHEIGELVEDAVKRVFGPIPLKAELSLAELHRLVRDVRRTVEWESVAPTTTEDTTTSATAAGPSSSRSEVVPYGISSQISDFVNNAEKQRRRQRRHFLSALFPTSAEGEREILAQSGVPTTIESELNHLFAASGATENELAYRLAEEERRRARARRAHEDAQLQALLDESKDWIDSDDFERVLALSLERVFAVWESQLGENVFSSDDGVEEVLRTQGVALDRERLVEEFSRPPKKVRLAALLPAVNAQGKAAAQSVPNEYAEALAEVKELKALSALIYSSWST